MPLISIIQSFDLLKTSQAFKQRQHPKAPCSSATSSCSPPALLVLLPGQFPKVNPTASTASSPIALVYPSIGSFNPTLSTLTSPLTMPSPPIYPLVVPSSTLSAILPRAPIRFIVAPSLSIPTKSDPRLEASRQRAVL